MPDPIALAIPVFFVLMGTELAVSWRQGRLSGARPTWRPVDALADLGCGISSQVTGLVLGSVVAVGAHVWVWEHLTPFKLPADAWWVWVGAFVVYDFVYYLWHWASHRVNFMWAAHQVHHQSEDFNLAVALRQSMLTPLTSLPFGLPLVLLGLPPIVLAVTIALNTLGQFWFHTRLIGRMGPLEAFLNTPSHHRVHHGVNPAYIDKNHAGVFIVWDRLFGTFAPETVEPVYGVVEGFPTASAWRANLDPWKKLWTQFRAGRGWEKLYVWVAPPEWRPAALGGTVTIPEPTPVLRWNPVVPRQVTAYVAVWMVLASGLLGSLLLGAPTWSLAQLAGVGALVLGASITWGGLLDRRAWGLPVEALRLLALPAVGLLFGGPWALAGLVGASLSGVALFAAGRAEHTPAAIG